MLFKEAPIQAWLPEKQIDNIKCAKTYPSMLFYGHIYFKMLKVSKISFQEKNNQNGAVT